MTTTINHVRRTAIATRAGRHDNFAHFSPTKIAKLRDGGTIVLDGNVSRSVSAKIRMDGALSSGTNGKFFVTFQASGKAANAERAMTKAELKQVKAALTDLLSRARFDATTAKLYSQVMERLDAGLATSPRGRARTAGNAPEPAAESRSLLGSMVESVADIFSGMLVSSTAGKPPLYWKDPEHYEPSPDRKKSLHHGNAMHPTPLELIDTATNRVVWTATTPQAAGPAAFSPDGKLIGYAGEDDLVDNANLRILGASNGSLLKTISVKANASEHKSRIIDIVFSRDNKYVGAVVEHCVRPGKFNVDFRAWDVRSGALVGASADAERLTMNADRSRGVGLRRDRDLDETFVFFPNVFDPKKRVELKKPERWMNGTDFAISADGKTVAGASGHRIYFWDTQTGAVRSSADNGNEHDAFCEPHAHPTENKIVTGSIGIAAIWNAKTGQKEREIELPGQTIPLGFNRKGELRVGNGQGGVVALVDIKSGKRLGYEPLYLNPPDRGGGGDSQGKSIQKGSDER